MRALAIVTLLAACGGPDPVGVCANGACDVPGCGNGVVEPELGEICDDGNRIALDGCSADCASSERCGDGIADPNAGETCDCGNDASNLPFGCSDINSMNANATCRPDCSPQRCGDGVLDRHEFCDDGNNIPGDGCRADCAGRWTKMASGTFALLEDVSATSATDAWAVGAQKILRWNGATWSSIPVPGLMSGRRFRRVYTPAKDELFVTGEDATGTLAVYHLIGGLWTDVTPATGTAWLTIGGSGSDLYLCGEDQFSIDYGRIAHWDGSAFVDPGSFGGDNLIWTVAVLADGSAFATTNQISFSNGGTVYRKPAGGSWAKYDPLNGNVVTANGTDVFVFVAIGTSTYSHDSGATFTPLIGAVELGANVSRASAANGSAIAVGDKGDAMICTGSQCVVSDVGTTANLWSVDAIDDKHAFIVGDHGTILY